VVVSGIAAASDWRRQPENGDSTMVSKLLVAAALAAAFVVPAYAATTYYVAQDAKSHKCSVTTKKPDGKTMMEIGTAGYNTRAAADAALKAASACTA
jgi:hypothetical protein